MLVHFAAPAGAQDAPVEPPVQAPAETPAPDPAPEPPVTADEASMTAEVGEDGGRIVVEAKGVRPQVPLFFSAEAEEMVEVRAGEIGYEIGVGLKVVQGKAKLLSLGIGGEGEVQSVSGDGLVAWSVRRVGEERFLDLEVDPGGDRREWRVVVSGRIAKLELPSSPDLLHLKAGQAVGFTSTVNVRIPADVSARLVAADGFLPLESGDDGLKRYEGSLGKRLAFALTRSSAVAAPVELSDARLEGTVDEAGKSASFVLLGTATVAKDDAVMDLLRGRAAAAEVPAGAGYRLELGTGPSQEPVYRLRFPKAGSYAVEVQIVARLSQGDEWKQLAFEIPTGAIVPVVLTGIAPESEFHEGAAVVPSRDGEVWRGFLPLHGRCELAWKPIRKTGEGKLFFTTTARINVGVEAGVLRQTSIVEYKILQGKLEALTVNIEGPEDAEILAVDGPNVLSWDDVEEGGARRLEVTLSQPIESTSGLRVRSQLALGTFPTRAQPLRFVPQGSIRHSGYIRVYNIGATRLEVANVSGMTQLAPDQFPEQNLPGGDRQVFVYRFPAAAHAYEIAADLVQPEVSVSQILVYELTEADRVIRADVELDIREAPLLEWNMFLPADYSVVSVSGAEVKDYQPGTQVENDERSLKVFFGKEVIGRQLVRIHLEKNEPAAAGAWELPRLRNPDAKSVRGEIGVASVPGYRFGVSATDKLTEIELARFQNSRPDLQQAFRIRERDWTATLAVESLPQSVEVDAFHLYSLKDQTAYASVVLNYFVTGAPVSSWTLAVPATAGNVAVVGKDVRQNWRHEGESLVVPLHQPAIGPYTLLVTYEEPVGAHGGVIQPGQVVPQNVRGERGFIQVVSPVQVSHDVVNASPSLLSLDPLELPAEFRLLSAAPPLRTYQYTSRPFEFEMSIDWFETGDTVPQVIDRMEAASRVTPNGQVETEVTLLVMTRGRGVLRTVLPDDTELRVATVAGESVVPRVDKREEAKEKPFYLIELPAGADANTPVEVRMQLGRPAKDKRYPVVTLPAMNAPVMKATWTIRGEQDRVLVPRKSQLPLHEPVLTENGLEWIAERALGVTAVIFVLLVAGLWIRARGNRNVWMGLAGIALLVAALVISVVQIREAREEQRGHLQVLEYELPVIAPLQQPTLVVGNYSELGARVSWLGVVAIVAGLALLVWSLIARNRRHVLRLAGGLLLAIGILVQGGGASLFYLVAAIVIALLLVPWLVRWSGQMKRQIAEWQSERATRIEEKKAQEEGDEGKTKDPGEAEGPAPGPSAATLIAIGLILSLGGLAKLDAQEQGEAPPPPVIPAGMSAADRISQEWSVTEGRLKATGSMRVTGEPGDTFLLLEAPAVLTGFTGERLRVSKREIAGAGPSYVVSIRSDGGDDAGDAASWTGTFSFEMQVGENASRLAVPTGAASVQEVTLRYDGGGWEFDSPAAMQVTDLTDLPEGWSGAQLLLAPLREAEIVRNPKARDVKAEETQFFVEVANLFLPSPGVIDGRHALAVRPSQGEVRELSLTIPEGFTVSEVGSGPVGEWQFDAEARVLRIVVEPAQANPFSLLVDTQGSLDPLPSEATLAPVAVADAEGEFGLVALAFGSEAQPETTDPDGLSPVNLSDFDQSLIPDRDGGKPVLHQVYRYGEGGGSLALRVAPVAPELRVFTKQVLSIGDERLVLGVNFTVEISRAGIFQMSFALPEGLEVESLSGSALSHWTELTEDGSRFVILHLSGQTIGPQQFALTLEGPAPGPTPEEGTGWTVPRFEVRGAQRQTGDLVVQPSTGTQLEALTMRNVSDVNVRELGGQLDGALAFRLLQGDWELTFAIERLSAWVTVQVLHEVVLREGQTRTNLVADLTVEKASIRSLRVVLPGVGESEARTLRASGDAVSDIVRVPDEADLWEIQFKRRILGNLQVRLEWERIEGTGEGAAESEQWSETLARASFPDLRESQSPYYFAVRAGARLELEPDELPRGWQEVDWGALPQELRESGDRNTPALVLSSNPPQTTLALDVRRHAPATGLLNLRVRSGRFTTVVSPVGDLLTSAEFEFEVIQRSSLSVNLPKGSRLYNVFVNEKSVTVVLEGDSYQFYVLPDSDGRGASVSFAYTSPHQDLSRKLELLSPRLNVPLEQIDWRVVVPEDFTLARHGGDLELSGDSVEQGPAGIDEYLELVHHREEERKRVAHSEIDRFNELLNAGEQIRALSVLNSVANSYSLDAASNEDYRVRLNTLQTQQAEVALHSRRQRLYRDNRADDPGFQRNAQLELAATRNPIINRNDVRYRPEDYAQFLEGTTEEDTSVMRLIAARLVAHQRSSEPAPQAISVTLPEDGRVYTFSRSVQVERDAPLELTMKLESPRLRDTSKEALVLILVAGICLALVVGWRWRTGR